MAEGVARRGATRRRNEHYRLGLAALMTVGIGVPAAAQPHELDTSVAEFNGVRTTGWLPFDFYRQSRIVFAGHVNGAATRLLLDSGAEATIVDKAVAERLGFKMAGTTGLISGRSITAVPLVGGVTIRIGAMELRNLTVTVVDLKPMSALIGMPLEVVLGREVFEHSVVDIDFPAGRIQFGSPEGYVPPSGARKVALKRFAGGRGRAVDVTLEEGPPVVLEFDLGSAVPVILQHPLWSARRLLEGRRSTTTVIGGAGGVRTAALVSLRRLRFAGIDIANLDAVLEAPAGPLERRLGNGVIGMPILSRFRITTDYAKDQLYLVPGPLAAKPVPPNRSGLRVVARSGALEVLHVAPHSPAEAAGWRVGERIVEVDGKPIDASYWRGDRWRWSEQLAGTLVELQVLDGTVRRLMLADYY